MKNVSLNFQLGEYRARSQVSAVILLGICVFQDVMLYHGYHFLVTFKNIRKHNDARGHHTPEDQKTLSAPVMLFTEFPRSSSQDIAPCYPLGHQLGRSAGYVRLVSHQRLQHNTTWHRGFQENLMKKTQTVNCALEHDNGIPTGTDRKLCNARR